MTRIPPFWQQRCRLFSAAGLTFFSVFSCESPQVVEVGGQTHFLRVCNPSTKLDSCGPELECLSNACTSACSAPSECSGYPGAVCVERPQRTSGAADENQGGRCDISCESDNDCHSISVDHSCTGSFCRQGDVDAIVNDSLDCEPGALRGDEVLLIGDSFFAASHEIAAQLEERARSDGVLQEGFELRDRSTLLDNALAFSGNGIAVQFAEGSAESPVRLVVMNGGGADATLGSCDPVDGECPLLVEAALAAEELLAQMSDDGVKNVIYVYYPDPQIEAEKERVDALRPLIQGVCQEAPLPCHFLDLRPSFEGNYGEYILSDGLNPTDAGAAVVADELWDLLQACLVSEN